METIAIVAAQAFVAALILVPAIAGTKSNIHKGRAAALAIMFVVGGFALLAQSHGIIHIEQWTL